MELMYQGVVNGEITLERWVETCCTTPARLFGVHPQKGEILPGADADIVIWDPTSTTTIGINNKHHMNMDHSAFEELSVTDSSDKLIILNQNLPAAHHRLDTSIDHKTLKR